MNKLKRIIPFCLSICLIVIAIIFVFKLEGYGENYTEEYTIYKNISDLTSVQDVENYLTNNKIAYKIKDFKLVLTEFDNVEYIINPDKTSGYIKFSQKLHNLAILDEKCLDVVTIETKLVEDKMIEIVYFDDTSYTYTKVGDNYYIKATLFYIIGLILGFWLGIILFFFTTIAIMGDFFDWLKERKKQKNIKLEGGNHDIDH